MTVLVRTYIVRHGETHENRAGIVQGQLDTSLNELGLEQARLVGEALRLVPFDFALTSDLSRATKTAEAILSYHPHVTLEKRVELRERFMGAMQGKMVTTRWGAKPADMTRESGAFFAARAESWWIKDILDGVAQLPRKTEPYHVLITTHGGFIGALIRNLVHGRKASCATGVVVERCLNASVTVVEVNEAREGLITQWGSVSHLRTLDAAVQTNSDEIE